MTSKVPDDFMINMGFTNSERQELWDVQLRDLSDRLRMYVKHNVITMGVDASGEIVFWMTDHQKNKYYKSLSNNEQE